MTESDVTPGGRNVREVPADFVINGQLPVLRQQKNARGRELFADRTDLKDGFRPDGRFQFNIGQAIDSGPVFVAGANNRQGQTGDLMPIHLRSHEFIHSICVRRGRKQDKQKGGNERLHEDVIAKQANPHKYAMNRLEQGLQHLVNPADIQDTLL